MLLAGSTPTYFAEAAMVMVAGAVIAYAAARAGLVPIVGFLLAGVLIGPSALGLVRDQEMVDAAAEVGVVLLLFTIGIEFSFERLARIRRLILGGGALQVGLATGVTFGVLAAFGVPPASALFTGFLVALSSTAIVLKLLGDRGESGAEHGQVALGLLIFQDLAIIPMVLLVPAIGGEGGSALEVAWALARAALLIAAVLVFARRLMPKLLEVVARTCSPEVFLLTVVAICFGTAWLTSLAGVSLSLGAFLAGLLVSESHFSEHALGEILPLQILFSATFFVSVGMLLDVRFLAHNLPLVAAAVGGTVLVKLLTTGFAARSLGYATPVSAAAALVLAQIGEFSFVLERTGREAGLSFAGLGEKGSQTFIAASVVLMVSTPMLAALGSRVGGRLRRHAETAEASHARVDESAAHLPPLENHVLVAGYGDAARRLARVLQAARIPFAVATLSPQGADEAEAEGFPVLRGDYTRQRTLELVGAERAKLMVVADDDPATAYRTVAVGRMMSPTLRIVVRTRYTAEVEKITAAGADRVVAEEMEGIVRLFSEVLDDYGVAADDAAGYLAALRRGVYAVPPAGAPSADAEETDAPAECVAKPVPAEVASAIVPRAEGGGGVDTRAVTVRLGAPLVGKALGGVGLEAAYGVAVRAVRLDGRWEAHPSPDTVVAPGMELLLAGTAEAFVRAAEAFRAPGDGDRADALPPPPGTAALISTEQVVTLTPTGAACQHLAAIRPVHPSAAGCEECLRSGDDWVHLRVCMTCGHVGCCDSSKNRHASAHFHATRHPIIRSLEPGETWGWCYEDEISL